MIFFLPQNNKMILIKIKVKADNEKYNNLLKNNSKIQIDEFKK